MLKNYPRANAYQHNILMCSFQHILPGLYNGIVCKIIFGKKKLRFETPENSAGVIFHA